MYHDFYRLSENPFNVTADPHFFYSSKCHSDAISNLLYGIQQRKGISVVTGEVGTGKTTLCRKLIHISNKKIKFALLLNQNFSDSEILRAIALDLGIITPRNNETTLIHVFNKFLLKESNKGNNVVCILDEAQNLNVNQLEQIRLLSNLETEKEKLLQIILVGQPELDKKLQLIELRQLRQRIAIHFRIEPLCKSDIKNYILHRITKVQKRTIQDIIFTNEAIDCIYKYTNGSPRTINILCDRALLAGFVLETYVINDQIIENCAKEIFYCEHHL